MKINDTLLADGSILRHKSGQSTCEAWSVAAIRNEASSLFGSNSAPLSRRSNRGNIDSNSCRRRWPLGVGSYPDAEIPGDVLARFSASPSGHSVYEFQDAYDAKRGWLTRIDLIDPSTLLTKRSKLTPGHQFETVSDTRVVYFPTALNGALRLFVYGVNDSAPTKGPELFKKNTWPGRVVAESGCNSAAFVNDDVLAITGGCPTLILTRSGDEFSQINFPGYMTGGELLRH
jgi:hypothetical protein